MMAPRWSETTNIKFVKLYREQECLWDQFHQLYNSKSARESAMTVIAREMDMEGFGPSEVNRKIKALRATYHSEMKKHVTSKKSGCGPDKIYISPLKWLEEMKHIMTAGVWKRKTQMFGVPLKRPHDSLEIEEAAIETEEEQYSVVEQDRDEDLFEPQSSTTINSAVTNNNTVIKRLKPIEATTPQPGLKKLKESASTQEMHENEFDIFGKHVASQLKRLKVEHAITAIGEINNILMQKRLASLVFGHVLVNPDTGNCSFSNSQDIQTMPVEVVTVEEAEEVVTT